MIDPSLSLAVSIQGNPGVYALLLGSGVSRSSGVPTGWEIVAELIRMVAKLKGEECGDDPQGWYSTSFGRGPDYSEILNHIAKSPAERMQLLRRYFEPTDEERQEGRKLPTPAHRAIAELVAKGYFRVLITTNFDRLLESALADLGIQPVVISTPDAAKGALPLAHSRCTVVKLNGDYLDTRLKNTGDELARYEDAIERLLDQVFDEYGLVV
ncbi:MAG TPA: SIR2 family protein [Bryobacteraceae bacterium]|nr:SIR2 family protein [Bryobacteraceae bacterium]